MTDVRKIGVLTMLSALQQQALGLLLVIDGAGSIGWYKGDLRKDAIGRTAFRLARLLIGVALVLG